MSQNKFIPPDRIYAQYKNKPKMELWLKINKSICQKLLFNIEEIHKMYNADLSSGYMLDILGEVVGIKRPVLKVNNPDITYQFGRFEFNSGHFNMSDIKSYTTAKDDLYRKLIKAKIFKNNVSPTPDNITSAVKFITNVECIVHEEKLAYYIEFKNQIKKIDEYILKTFDILPRPVGVKFLRIE